MDDSFGVTGRRLLDTFAKNQKVTFHDVVAARAPNCKHTAQEIASARRRTIGSQIAQLLAFKLRQIDTYTEQIKELKALIDVLVAPYEGAVDIVDSMPGFGRQSAIDVIAEIGVDMDVFQNANQLAAWAGLTPGNHESAGKKSPIASCMATNTSSVL